MNRNKRLHMIRIIGLLTLLSIGFQNCSKISFAPIDAMSTAEVSTVTPDQPESSGTEEMASRMTPTPMPPPIIKNDFEIAYTGACAIFQGVLPPTVDPNSSEDVFVSNKVTNVQIDMARDVHTSSLTGDLQVGMARSVDIFNQTGHVLVLSASGSNRILNVSDGVQVNAKELTEVANVYGPVCLHAKTIGLISNANAGTKVIASHIDKIIYIHGDIHIYRARVELVENVVGNICLHDGAEVVIRRNITGKVGTCL